MAAGEQKGLVVVGEALSLPATWPKTGAYICGMHLDQKIHYNGTLRYCPECKVVVDTEGLDDLFMRSSVEAPDSTPRSGR